MNSIQTVLVLYRDQRGLQPMFQHISQHLEGILHIQALPCVHGFLSAPLSHQKTEGFPRKNSIRWVCVNGWNKRHVRMTESCFKSRVMRCRMLAPRKCDKRNCTHVQLLKMAVKLHILPTYQRDLQCPVAYMCEEWLAAVSNGDNGGDGCNRVQVPHFHFHLRSKARLLECPYINPSRF